MYISAYTDIDGIVISYTIVHTQHNTWRKKNIQYIGPVKQGCEKWRDESGLLWKKNRIINKQYSGTCTNNILCRSKMYIKMMVLLTAIGLGPKTE